MRKDDIVYVYLFQVATSTLLSYFLSLCPWADAAFRAAVQGDHKQLHARYGGQERASWGRFEPPLNNDVSQ